VVYVKVGDLEGVEEYFRKAMRVNQKGKPVKVGWGALEEMERKWT
jgi:hypothetical protein